MEMQTHRIVELLMKMQTHRKNETENCKSVELIMKTQTNEVYIEFRVKMQTRRSVEIRMKNADPQKCRVQNEMENCRSVEFITEMQTCRCAGFIMKTDQQKCRVQNENGDLQKDRV